MSLICSISGTPPKEPVVSPDGIIFDRMAIIEHLRGSDNCPVTGSTISEFSLTPVRDTPHFIQSRSGTLTRSIPGFLNVFRMEFDKVVVGNLGSRTQLKQTLHEIADIMTTCIASRKVIERLIQEVNEANAERDRLRSDLDTIRHGRS